MVLKKMKSENSNNSLNVFYLLRVARNKKVKDLAEELNVTSSYIHSIEKGEKIPSLQLLIKYADALNVSPDILLSFSPIDKGEHMFYEKSLLKLLRLICNVVD